MYGFDNDKITITKILIPACIILDANERTHSAFAFAGAG